MSTNLALAETFREVADLLELEGVKFKPEAYRRAARSLEALAEDVRKVADRGELEEIPGIGEAIAEKIREYLRSGAVSYLEKLRRELPPGLVELMHLSGLGPKTAHRFWTELGIEGPAELAEAIEKGRLDGLKGFGPRKIELLRAALSARSTTGQRMGLLPAWRIAGAIVRSLRSLPSVDRVEAAGSLRRCRETVGDLDILVTSSDPERVFDAFSSLAGVTAVKLRGATKETIEWTGGLQVDLRVVEPASFGAALQYFTGSKDHNVHLRSIARDMGLKVNEYGVFRGEARVASATEEEVYASLGLSWVPPEIREDHGEIEAAARKSLPPLVAGSDLKGVLHVHVPPDGAADALSRIRSAAAARRFEYVGVVIEGPPGASGFPPSPPRLADDPAPAGPEGAAAPPRVWVGCEVDLPEPGEVGALPEGWDFWVARPTPASREADAPPRDPPLLIAHAGAPEGEEGTGGERQDRWIRLARSWGAALDLSPDGPVDSAGARSAWESGVRLHLSPARPVADTVGPDPFDALSLSVGRARRAGAGPAAVLNTQSGIDPLPTPRPPARRARPRR